MGRSLALGGPRGAGNLYVPTRHRTADTGPQGRLRTMSYVTPKPRTPRLVTRGARGYPGRRRLLPLSFITLALGFMVTAAAVNTLSAQAIGTPVTMALPDQAFGLGIQPKVVSVGSLLVGVWSANSFGSALLWATSMDGGRNWSPGANLTPHPLLSPSNDYGGGAATLASSLSGHVYLAYRIVGRNDFVHRLVVRRGTAASTTVTWESPVIAVGFDAEGVRNADSPWLACDPTNDHLYLAYVSHALRNDAYVNEPGDEPVYLVRSLDGGQSWSAPLLLGGPAALGTRVEVGESGQVYVCWQDYASGQVMMRRSEDHGETFADAVPVARFVDNHGTRVRGILTPGSYSGRQHPINYYEGGVFDFSQLAVDRSSGPRRGTLYVVWAEGAEGTTGPGSGRVVQDTLPNDTPATATLVNLGDSWVSVGYSEVIDPNGGQHFFAFDGTQGTMVELHQAQSQFPASISPFHSRPTGVDYQDAIGPSSGLTLYSGGYLDDGTAPPLLFTLPRTTRYILPGALSGGPTSVVVSGAIVEHLVSPISVARDHRDIVLVWSRDGGRTWSPKVRVNDDPPGADQALPAVTVDHMGRIHVAWMDRRDGPIPGHTASPYWTFSDDGGITFRPSRRLSSPGSDYEPRQLLGTIGDFIGIQADGGTVGVAYPQMTSGWPTATFVRITDLPTGIAVQRFTAEPEGEAVRVTWSVADAAGITGFGLDRAPGGTEDYERVATVAAHGQGEYTLRDAGTQAGAEYRYRLEVVRGDRTSLEGPIDVAIPAGIATLAFERVGPNPFAQEAKLVVAVPQRSWLDVRVYDVQGHEVRRLHSGETPAGRYVLAWDGRDSGAREAAPGVYHLRAVAGGRTATRSLVRVR